ncbi:MAG: hypothetical protein AB7G23_09740 [Vicinamibacterales bacterium]
MRKHSVVAAATLSAGLFAVALGAQEAAPAQHVKAMQDIRAAVQVFADFSRSQDFDAAAAAGTSARAAFQSVEQFWKERRDTEAAQQAAAGGRAAGDAAAAAGLRSAEGVTFAAEEMGATCMGCHTAHRIRREDGTFAIK